MEEILRRTPSPISKFSKLFIGESQNPETSDEEPLAQDAETLEIAAQLTSLRKRHDKLKQSNIKKQLYCEKIKSELDTFELSATTYESESKQVQSKITQTILSLDETKQKIESERMNKKSYLFVLERIKQEKLALEIKSNTLQGVLKESKDFLEAETEKFRKIRENQYSSKLIIQEIKHAMFIDKRKKQERILQLEKSVKDQKELAQRREERKKRQFDISEAAANDDKDSQEAKIRETYLLNKMWSKFTEKKLKLEVKKGIEIEKAFQAIKQATGISDFSDIVENFLSQGENYEKTKKAVKDSETRLELVKKYNAETRGKLAQVQLIDNGNSRKLYSEIEDIEKKLAECYKESALGRDRLGKSILVYDRILNWGVRVCEIIGVEDELDVPAGSSEVESKDTLEDMFERINGKLEQMINKVSDKKTQAKQVLDVFARRKTVDILSQFKAEMGLMKKGKKIIEKGGSSKTSDSQLPRLKDKSTERLNY